MSGMRLSERRSYDTQPKTQTAMTTMRIATGRRVVIEKREGVGGG
jgi:hypothetical protein